MDLSIVHTIYRSFAGDRLSFLYSGLFHDEHTARLIALGEEFLGQNGADKGVRGKLAFIMVEMYQNIVRHRAGLASEVQEREGRSMFLLRSTSAQHEIVAINPIASADAENVKKELARLDGLDRDQMKQVFLLGLQNDARTQRGGAGLGLIEMARRSGHPLRHALSPLGTSHYLFALQALVGRNANWRSAPLDALSLHALVAELGISVLCRGNLTAGEQEVVLRMIERDLDEDRTRSDARSRAFLATMELVENLGTTGEGPMVFLGKVGAEVRMVLAAHLRADAVTRITKAVEEVNALDAPGSQRRYRDILLGRVEASDTIQLGLIELARRHSAPLRMAVAPDGFMVLEAVI
ncbi:MAG TPA: SiaB family protein kinase [Flavobacteriales bacterium]|jgi:hypothetical protein|nr:hypothetical protein [Flavobacteriales bacterium]MBK7113852.1 hypothetical protein [Flavobacteriales bacterium]MBK7620769.1 hypothetical protein [Flavobacteriales bacterium]MBP9176669.1 SiaB family protein kinase [Flavobacteriales bacterium]MCC6911172.1 hypothetical protein [Flavobacteriales bacterium]